MDRYRINTCKIEQVTKVTVGLRLARNSSEAKEFIIYEGDKISFLYTESMEDVGKNDKIVRGTVVGIMKKRRYNIKQITPNYQPYESITHLQLSKDDESNFDDIVLVIDESARYQTNINKYTLSKILDINPIDYEYPEDNPTSLDSSKGLSTFDIAGVKITETQLDPNSSGNPYPAYPSSYTKASSADYEECGVTDAIYRGEHIYKGEYSHVHGVANSQVGVAESKMGIAESKMGVAESNIGVATPDMVVEKTEIGVATPKMNGGVLKL